MKMLYFNPQFSFSVSMSDLFLSVLFTSQCCVELSQ